MKLTEQRKVSILADAIKEIPVGGNITDDMVRLPDEVTPVKHHFAYGVYGREMFIPKGVAVIGKIHKRQTMNFLMQGCLEMNANGVKETVKAPAVIIGVPGTQRAVLAVEDSIWVCVHPTEETDLDMIENQFIARSLDDPDLLAEIKRLEDLE